MSTRWPAFERNVPRLIAAALTIVSMSGSAFAAGKDSMAVVVTNATAAPVIKNNGQAVGTIQLLYVVNAHQFTTGLHATFDVDWSITAAPKPADYGAGVPLSFVQDQQGGNVRLSASPANFTLTSAAQTGTTTISVYIQNGKDGSAPPALDQTDLVGNLKIVAGSAVGTVTNIQVHILLAHPTSCIKVYNFVTDQDFNLGVLSTTNLNVPVNGRNAGKVVSSQPGQFSTNVLVANLCGTTEAFDLRVDLDDNFSTGASPNSVFAYNEAGEYDLTTFGALLTTAATSYKQSLCVQNVVLAAGASALVTVHSQLKDVLYASALPVDRSFDFSAWLFDAPNTSCSGELEPLAAPNAASFSLPFTVNGD